MKRWDKILQKTKQNAVKHGLAMFVTSAILLTLIPLTSFGMQVFVHVNVDSDKGSMTLEIEPTDRIEDIKQKISDKNGIPTEDQILIFAGKVLKNEKSIQDYSVQKDAAIQLYVGRALDISDGDISISETGYRVGNTMETAYNGQYVICGETTQNTIRITGKSHHIVLVSLNMRFSQSADLIEIDGGTVCVEKIGKNIIQATADGSGSAVKMSNATKLHFGGTGSSILVGGSNYHGGSHAVTGGYLYVDDGDVTLIGGRKIVNSFGHAFQGEALIVTGGTLRCGVGYLNDSNYAEPTVSAPIQIYCGTLLRAVAHSLQYSQEGTVITEKCVCGHEETATLAPPTGNLVYDGCEKRAATVTYSGGWAGGELIVTYTNNVNVGTATASITKDGKTATVCFNIDKAEQFAPIVGKVDETISGKKDGKLTGLTEQMEFRKDGETEYADIVHAQNLADGKYYVRMKEDSNRNASAETEVIIAPGRKLIVTYIADGKVIVTKEVAYGEDAVVPAIPAKDGYTQIAPVWDKDGKNTTSDTEIRAVYTQNPTPAPSSPQTGDTVNIWFFLLFASGAGMLAVILGKRRLAENKPLEF